MRALIACEHSKRVRNALRKKGHDARNCDWKDETADYFCDVREVIHLGWDMMIAFPDCTYLSSSGLHWNKRIPGRQEKTGEALAFVRMLMDADIEKIAIENPIGCISTQIRKPDQIIQPWQFGHPESKSTCLWLKNLPLLVPTNVLELPESGRWENQCPGGQNKLGPSPDRAKIRGLTYQGIADAMGDQWG